jgi:hypothetical protein
LEKNLIILKEFDEFSESSNKDNIHDIKMCKIVVRKGTECKTITNTDKIINKLFKCLWPQCRYSCKTIFWENIFAIIEM